MKETKRGKKVSVESVVTTAATPKGVGKKSRFTLRVFRPRHRVCAEVQGARREASRA